jgi:hypothetical protein
MSHLIRQALLDREPNLMQEEIDLAFGAKDRKTHVILFLDLFLIYFPYNDDLNMPS